MLLFNAKFIQFHETYMQKGIIQSFGRETQGPRTKIQEQWTTNFYESKFYCNEENQRI